MNKILVSTLLLFLFLSSCTLHEPSLPAWDTQWNMVLPTEDFVMSEIIEEDSLLAADTTLSGIPIISFSMTDSSDWQNITQDDLSLDPDDQDYVVPIGQIKIDSPPELTSDSVMMVEFFPPELLLYAQMHNDTIPPFPGFTINPPDHEMAFDEFSRVMVDSGSVWITFHNNMLLTIKSGMEINLYNNGPGNGLIGTFVFNEDIPGGSEVKSQPLDLAGKEISNLIRLEYDIPIAGSDTTNILDDDFRNSYFFVNVSMADLKVDWAEAKIPSQEFTQSDSVDTSEEKDRLRQAEINSGSIDISLANNLAIDTHIKLVLPDFTKNGQTKTVFADIPAGQDYSQQVSLDGWTISNHKNTGEFIDYIFYNVFAEIDSTENYVLIRSTDSVEVNIQINTLYFNSVVGSIDTVKIEIDPTEADGPDFFEEFEGGLRLEDLVMTMDFENQIDFPINLDLTITTEREENGIISDSRSLSLQQVIQRSSVSERTEIILDKNSTSPSIVDLLEILPSTIRVSGKGYIVGEGAVELDQGVRVKYSVESPLTLKLDNPVARESEIDSIKKDDLKKDARKALTEDLQEAFIELSLTNGVPVGAEVLLYLASDSTNLFDNVITDSSAKIIVGGLVKAGETDGTGYVSNPEVSLIPVSLSVEELQIFNSSPIYIRQEVVIQPTSRVVRIRQNDKIVIGAKLNVKYTVNSQDN